MASVAQPTAKTHKHKNTKDVKTIETSHNCTLCSRNKNVESCNKCSNCAVLKDEKTGNMVCGLAPKPISTEIITATTASTAPAIPKISSTPAILVAQTTHNDSNDVPIVKQVVMPSLH